MDINKVLQTGRETLSNNGVNPREARFLLAFAMDIRSEELIKYKECSDEQYIKYIQYINRRVSKEPYAYIVGYKEFMKLKFKVNKNVLIPREDTEVLVQEIIECVKTNFNNKFQNKDSKVKILDMCTGSGCIAISLAKYIENADITAVDISNDALQIAKENAIINNVKVNFINSNLFDKINEKFDIIVSNPPYIRKEVIESLQDEVKKEPILALDGGESGLEFYNKIATDALNYLNENGILAFEIGYDQGDEVAKILKDNDFKDIKIKKDISGNNRVVIGKI